ncbi:hydantoinase/oxoprolinase family protein [Chloroflexota bacterium]
MIPKREIRIMGSDAGGTMTDMFAVDREGDFVVGKASTTPKDESIGFWESIIDAGEYWNLDWEKEAKELLPQVDAAVYCGTAMLNVFLTREGRKLGLVSTRGHEDTLLHERAKHVHASYGYPDKLHKVTHVHNEPLVPRKLVKGVTERITMFGEPLIPLYEHEAKEAIEYLLARGVEGIVIWFLYSYLNPMHEIRVGQIAQEIMKEKAIEVPIYLSSQVCPIMREVSRLTSTLLHAYAAEPARKQLLGIEKKLTDSGYQRPLQIVLSSGSLANIRYHRLHEAAFSGPIGGLMGGQYLSGILGIPNLVCSDMGGTSFDVGLLTGGDPILSREVELAHMIFNIPTMVMDSIGAGCGMYLTINTETGRLEIGPDSAGADPGPVSYNMGNVIPTVMDCCVILGMLNPDYYLGGKIKLRKDLALQEIKERCSNPLGVDPYDFSEGVVSLINLRMREHINTVIAVRGFSTADYHLVGYGGAGPLFLANYAEGLPFKGVFTVPFAAAFSAFGCTATDYVHRYQKSTVIALPWGADEATKMQMGYVLNMGWDELEATALREIREEGISEEQVKLEQIAYIRYMQQMEDLEVVSPVKRINTPEDMDKLIEAFEDKYSKVYFRSAKYPQGGYQMLELGLRASAEKPKPAIKKYPLSGKKPPKEAEKGHREVYTGGRWIRASLYEMDLLQPGNEVQGLAVIEAPSTTFFVPEGKKVRVDEHKILWLEEKI